MRNRKQRFVEGVAELQPPKTPQKLKFKKNTDFVYIIPKFYVISPSAKIRH